MKWKIGNVEIENQLVLAPMAGITMRHLEVYARKWEPVL